MFFSAVAVLVIAVYVGLVMYGVIPAPSL